jgi:hypothetical protein
MKNDSVLFENHGILTFLKVKSLRIRSNLVDFQCEVGEKHTARVCKIINLIEFFVRKWQCLCEVCIENCQKSLEDLFVGRGKA